MTEEEINERKISFQEIEARAKAKIENGFKGKAIIAFIDLLGFRNEINSNWEKDPDPLLRIMKLKAYWDVLNDRSITNIFFEYDESTQIIETKYPEVITFSDSFIFLLPLNDENTTTILASILTVATAILEVWRNCIDEGFTIRGGIDYGDVYHNGLDIVGPGLISAYEMESKKAKISRVIISENIKKIIDQNVDQIQTILQDYFLRYFKPDIDNQIIINPAMIPDPARGSSIDLISKIMKNLTDHDALVKYFDLLSRLRRDDRSKESREMYRTRQ